MDRRIYKCLLAALVVLTLAACDSAGRLSESPFVPTRVLIPGTRQNPMIAQALLYVTASASGVVRVLSYPKGKPVATLSGFSSPTGECVDKKGDVFITDTETDGAGIVYEFEHGGMSPIATLTDPFTFPNGCAVDPVTGNLALVGFGGLAIFPNASGTPETFTDTGFEFMKYAGYDPSGNLFVGGDASGGGFAFAELPSGGSNLINISVPGVSGGAGAVQWDGQYMTVQTESSNKGRPVIDRLQVSGSTAVIVGTTTMSSRRNKYNGGQFWLQGRTVIGPIQNGEDIAFWRYPDGGKPKKTIKNMGNGAWGIAVSIAK